ncbi:MAG: DegQ family serine endoprotease [Candidatus Eisenbacteria bacterium]|nr:DegQ family serine endoprotease [Candidatus Eisenbacteria bacterium]
MIKRRELMGVAALSAFLGAFVGLFLFGEMGGKVSPGTSATASPIGAQVEAVNFPVGGDPGIPLTTTTFSNVAELVMPSIVVITSSRTIQNASTPLPFGGTDPFMRRFFGNPFQDGDQPKDEEVRGLGSGVIVSADGYILTNNHVVNEADKVQVRLDRHTLLDATIVGTDPRSDLAVLKVDRTNMPALPFGNSDNVKIGEWVVACGAPFGLERSITVGIVSAKGRSNVGVTDYEDFIQTDAAINRGNSGGALINLRGEMVGINTAIATQTGGSNGVGFSIPINMARYIMKSLIEDGKVTRGWIGVNIANVDEKIARGLGLPKDATGVVVSGVTEGSPADRAGIRSNDVITKLDGHPVDDIADLRNRVATTKPGTSVELSLLRDRSTLDVSVKLDELPSNLAENTGRGTPEAEEEESDTPQVDRELGLSVATLTTDKARELEIKERRGVLVTGIGPNSAAAQAGLRPDDVILEVNKNPVQSADEFRNEVKKAGGAPVLRILRDDNYLFIVF